jgi:hypothetical protein
LKVYCGAVFVGFENKTMKEEGRIIGGGFKPTTNYRPPNYKFGGGRPQKSEPHQKEDFFPLTSLKI